MNKWSILGNPVGVQGESSNLMLNNHTFRYSTKLEFPRFGGEDVDEWLFKVEQFFLLEGTIKQSKMGVVALHLEGCVLHWHKFFLKLKGKLPIWREYKGALRGTFGPLAYEDPKAKFKKLKQVGPFQDYLRAFDVLLDKAQLGEE